MKVSRSFLLIVLVALMVGAAIPALAAEYTGALYYGYDDHPNGLVIPDGSWKTARDMFQWTVTDGIYNGNNMWHYVYNWTVDPSSTQGSISHLLIEVSQDFEAGDIAAWSISGSSQEKSATIWKIGDGTDTMPNSTGITKAIKFEGVQGNVIVDFWSGRAPVWGDFYAKDGSKAGYAYNAGFLLADPTSPAADGTMGDQYKILRPDSIPTVPEPASVMLAILGLSSVVGFGKLRRK